MNTDIMMPLLTSKSEILNEKMIVLLNREVPNIMKIRPWSLLFSISHDGGSMITFYEMTKKYSGTIILVRDSKNAVFGGYANAEWHIDKYFYGTGESFIFSYYNTTLMDVYRWNGGPEYFMWSDDSSIALGGGEKLGLYIYEDFTKGKTNKCLSFNNKPLTSVEFNIDYLEVWGSLK